MYVQTEELQKKRELFIEELIAGNYTTYFVATHPKYAAKTKSNFGAAFRFTSEPTSLAVPYMWKYKEARQKLMKLADILTPEEAERRNINFVNPALKDIPGATLPTLRGGIQLLLPGERAYAHRHSANAFRFILESPTEGAYTVVQDRKIPMQPGDLVMTPNWTWHDHHNDGKSPAIWFDGLDALMAFWIGAGFYQEYEESGEPGSSDGYQKGTKSIAEVQARFGSGLIPADEFTIGGPVPAADNPLLYYPYNEARKQLLSLSEIWNGTPSNGVVLRYVNPVTAKSTFPSMETAIRLVKPMTELKPSRRTENVIFITMEGNPSFEVKGQKFETEPYDVVALPSWTEYSIKNPDGKPAMIFSFSDKPVFEYLGLYRERVSSS